MDAMSSQSNLHNLLQEIKRDYPDITLKKASAFRWDPASSTVFFNDKADANPVWSLLHELGHVDAGHAKYTTDTELLIMEAEAWQRASALGIKYGHPIDEEHTQDCLDSYRDWLNKRSRCPTCHQTGVEKEWGLYHCINCRSEWQVSKARFCRVYRKTKSTA
jgi:hypothetical protein